MCCPNCRLSLNTLKEMQKNHTEFPTAKGKSKLWIAEVDETLQTIRMERSTGKITWSLPYKKLKEVHDRIHQGDLMLDPYVIDEIVPLWGNYITGLLKHVGCMKIR
jgi:hypothetical protein